MRPSAGLASGFDFLEGNACTGAVATTVPSNTVNKAFFSQRPRGNECIKLECRPVTGSQCFANYRKYLQYSGTTSILSEIIREIISLSVSILATL